MGCKDCAERRKNLRDAILHGEMAKARDITVEGLRVMIGIDAGADHRKASVVGNAAPEAITPEDAPRRAKKTG